MPQNLTPSAVFTAPVPGPQDGERVTADSANMGDGPTNPAFQALTNRTQAIVARVCFLPGLARGDACGCRRGLQPVSIRWHPLHRGHGSKALPRRRRRQRRDRDGIGDQSIDHGKLFVTDSQGAATADTATVTSGGVKFTNTKTGANDANPPRTTSLLNLLLPLLGVKAWYHYKTNGSGGSIGTPDGGNVLTVTYPATNQIAFFFAGHMDSAEYTVIPFCQSGVGYAYLPVVNRAGADHFILDFGMADYHGGGAPVAVDPANAAGVEIFFLVLGRQTT